MATKKDADPKLTRRQGENVRAAIKTSQLKNRLEANALGTLTKTVDGKKELIELSTGQIKSAEILLNRTLPSQTYTEIQTTTPLNPKELESEFNKLMARANKDTKDAIDDNKVSPITNAKSSNSKV